MSDDTNLPAASAPAVPAKAREIRVVESVSPIMDTARFEHLGRVATVMARAGLMPESLTCIVEGTGNNRKAVPLDFEVIQARAFLIANQADLWKADPNAIAQCTSLVHGKLMYEGKLVHGLIETRLGVRLRYEFGTYDHRSRTIKIGEIPGPDDQALGVRVSARFEDEDFDREIIGSVGMWHTGDRGPWGKSTAWMRQLRYMGAREWGRAHSPGLLLGIMTDDEIESYEERRGPVEPRSRKVDLGAKLAGLPAPGFSTEHVENETGNGKKAAAEETPHDPVTGEVLEGEVSQPDPGPKPPATRRKAAAPKETAEDVKARQEAETKARLEAAEAAGEAGREDALTGQSRDVSGMTEEETRYYENGYATGKAQREALDAAAAEAKEAAAPPADTSGAEPQEDDEEEDVEVVWEGHAAPGEVYMHAEDEWGEDGKTPTYKDGEPFSRVGQKGAEGLKVYAEHSPAPAADPKLGEQQIADAGGAPGDEDEYGPVELALQDMSGSTSWLQIKAKLPALYALPEFADAGPDYQRDTRATIWDMVLAVKEAHKDPVDHASDVSAFRLWMDTQEGKDGADAIEGTFRTLKREPVWDRLNDGQKTSVEKGVVDTCVRLRGA